MNAPLPPADAPFPSIAGLILGAALVVMLIWHVTSAFRTGILRWRVASVYRQASPILYWSLMCGLCLLTLIALFSYFVIALALFRS